MTTYANYSGDYSVQFWASFFPSYITFAVATESYAGSGIPGNYQTASILPSVVDGPTVFTSTAPNDGKARFIIAQTIPILSGSAAASAWTLPVSINPWAIPNATASLVSSYTPSGSATTVEAAGVYAGEFGANVGGGNYQFPGTLVVGSDPGGSQTLRVGGNIFVNGGSSVFSTSPINISSSGRFDLTMTNGQEQVNQTRWDVFSFDGVAGPTGTLAYGICRTDAGVAGNQLIQAFRSGTNITQVSFPEGASFCTLSLSNGGGMTVVGGSGPFIVNGPTSVNNSLNVNNASVYLNTNTAGVYFIDAEGSQPHLLCQSDNHFVFYGTTAAGGNTPIWASYMRTATGSFEVYASGGLIVYNKSFLDGDVAISTLGTFDSTNAGNGTPTSNQLLSYNGSKWVSRTVQLTLTSGEVEAGQLSDGTAVSFAYVAPAFNVSPSTPSAPILTPIYNGMIVDMGSTPPAGTKYVVDYRVNSGSFTSGAISTTGQKIVHSLLTQGDSYAYKVYEVGNSVGSYSPASPDVSPATNSEVNAYGLVLASQISTVNLASIVADLGTIQAGMIQNSGSSPTAFMRVSTGYSGSVTGSGMYIDLAASAGSPILQHPQLTLSSNGTATFGGEIMVRNPNIPLSGLPNAWLQLGDSQLATGMTSLLPTNVAGVIGEQQTQPSASRGGLYVEGIGGTVGLVLNGTTSGGLTHVLAQGHTFNGTNRTFAVGTDPIFSVANHGTTLFTVNGAGNIAYTPGSASLAYASPVGFLWSSTPTHTSTANSQTTLDSFVCEANTMLNVGDTMRIVFSTNNGANSGAGGAIFQLKWGSVVLWTIIPSSTDDNINTMWTTYVTVSSMNAAQITVQYVSSDHTSGTYVTTATPTFTSDETVAIQGDAPVNSTITLYQATAVLEA